MATKLHDAYAHVDVGAAVGVCVGTATGGNVGPLGESVEVVAGESVEVVAGESVGALVGAKVCCNTRRRHPAGVNMYMPSTSVSISWAYTSASSGMVGVDA